jgi:hypothetical protein
VVWGVLGLVGLVMLAEWLRKAGADGKKIIDQYRAMQ